MVSIVFTSKKLQILSPLLGHNSWTHDGIWPVFERNWDIMPIQVVCKFDQHQIENVASIVFTSKLWTDGRRTKCDHKSSPCQYVTGELKSMYTYKLYNIDLLYKRSLSIKTLFNDLINHEIYYRGLTCFRYVREIDTLFNPRMFSKPEVKLRQC